MSFPMSPASTSDTQMPACYSHPTYMLRRRILVLLGARVDIFTPDGRPVLFCQQKAFKLKEDIRLYADETKQQELLVIKARNVIDFSAAYDVTDGITGQVVGTLRRKGWSSMVRDAWEVMDAHGRLIAQIEEDNIALALVRRLLTNLIPQSFNFVANGATLAEAKQHFNPFVHKMDLRMPQGEAAKVLDPRLVLAATTLLVLIEGRQS